MKKNIFLLGFVALAIIGMSACKSSQRKNENNSDKIVAMSDDVQFSCGNARVSLDWAGTYTGVLPCADCIGIQTTVELKFDKTYKKSVIYLGRDENVFQTTGTFTWNKEGNTITFDNKNETGGFPTRYFVAENKLIQLDIDGSRITGDLADRYILRKLDMGESSMSLTETHWRLIEINGQAVTPESGNPNEPHIIFNVDGNRVFGNGGCNSFRGVYELGPGDRLSFPKPMAMTMMMCISNMEIESQFMEILGKVDSYAIKGDTLSLHRARMAPLARFVAVQ